MGLKFIREESRSFFDYIMKKLFSWFIDFPKSPKLDSIEFTSEELIAIGTNNKGIENTVIIPIENVRSISIHHDIIDWLTIEYTSYLGQERCFVFSPIFLNNEKEITRFMSELKNVFSKLQLSF